MVEALIGAAYLTHGLEPTREVVTRLVSRFLSAAPTRGAGLDWKTSLQELTAAHHLGSPSYEVVGEGPDHRRVFTATALVDGRVLGRGTGSSKKTAEHDAAEAAYAELLARHGDGGLDLPGVNEALRADLGLPDPGADLGLPGFRVTSIDYDFFVKNYPEPIFENGIQLFDMLRLTLRCPDNVT